MCLIGVTPCLDEKSGKLTLNRDYPDALTCVGALPVILPMETDEKRLAALLSRLDGVLLSGGEDVAPERYGEARLPCCGEPCPKRDEAELTLCRLALEKDMPVLAICRGIQVLNVALGGTLFQDIAEQYGGAVKHPVYDRPREPVHAVEPVPGTKLRAIVGQTRIAVNSRHHQAVKEAGRGLIVSARAEDALIEGVEMPGRRFVLGVQWHPESLRGERTEAHAIFAAFADACRAYAEDRR